MGLNIGNKALKDAYIGDKPIKKIYLGDKLLWQRLPYDAEIEYLEANGTQYVDLGLKANQRTTIDIDFFATQSSNIRVFGARTDWRINAFVVSFYGAGDTRAIFCYDNVSDSNVVQFNADLYDNNWHNAKSNGNGHISIDGINKQTNYTAFTTQYNIILFGYNNAGTILCGNIRIRKCKINDLDLIPVRIGQVGYMYDKVSNQLFGNSGTGDFILGPDIE